MILLTSIEVTNIRSIAHGTIEPLPGGITALVGAIGTGKSTFLEVARSVGVAKRPGFDCPQVQQCHDAQVAAKRHRLGPPGHPLGRWPVGRGRPRAGYGRHPLLTGR